MYVTSSETSLHSASEKNGISSREPSAQPQLPAKRESPTVSSAREPVVTKEIVASRVTATAPPPPSQPTAAAAIIRLPFWWPPIALSLDGKTMVSLNVMILCLEIWCNKLVLFDCDSARTYFCVFMTTLFCLICICTDILIFVIN